MRSFRTDIWIHAFVQIGTASFSERRFKTLHDKPCGQQHDFEHAAGNIEKASRARHADKAAEIEHGSSRDSLAEWIQCAVDDKKLSCENPAMAAKVFGAMVSGAFVWPAMYQRYLDPKTIEPVKKELIETFLCRYRSVKMMERGN